MLRLTLIPEVGDIAVHALQVLILLPELQAVHHALIGTLNAQHVPLQVAQHVTADIMLTLPAQDVTLTFLAPENYIIKSATFV